MPRPRSPAFPPLAYLRFALVLAGVLMAAPAARADFTLCNKTAHPMVVAIGLQRGKAWHSEGWWRVAPGGACRVLVKGRLRARYYYLLAVHEGVAGNWDGPVAFCVSARNFSIKGRENCAKRGFARAGFLEVDTQGKLTWVQNLSD